MNTHVRYLQSVKFFNGLADIKAGEVVRITRHLGKGAAYVVRDNGDSWAEIGIDDERAEYCQAGNPSTAQLKHSYPLTPAINGQRQWQFVFDTAQGEKRATQLVPVVQDEFEQAALVRAALAIVRAAI